MRFLSSVLLIASLAFSNIKASWVKTLSNEKNIWVPYQGMSWNDVLGDAKFDISKENAEVIIVDYETKPELIELYHSYGKKVICYFSGGTIESWRDDVRNYESVSGLVRNVYGRWEKERWLDFRKSGIKPLIRNRMQKAVNSKCDALEVDNLDAYQSKDVKGVWSDPINEEDTVVFAKWLAETAHELGISIGLKNIPGLIDNLIDDFDFALNESCDKYVNECSLYKNFVASGKAVFGITYGKYDKLLPNLCKELNGSGISLIVKESQNIRQDGHVFNGERDCGSSFETGYINTASSPLKNVSAKKMVNSSNVEKSAERNTVKTVTTINNKGKKVVVVVKTVVKKKQN